MNTKVWLLLQRAREDLGAAEDVLQIERPWRAATDAYYAIFHAAEALLLSLGIETSFHSATQAAFGQQFARTAKLVPKLHRYFLNAFDKRITADYDVTVKLRTEEVEELVRQAKEFAAAAESYPEGVERQGA